MEPASGWRFPTAAECREGHTKPPGRAGARAGAGAGAGRDRPGGDREGRRASVNPATAPAQRSSQSVAAGRTRRCPVGVSGVTTAFERECRAGEVVRTLKS